MRLIDADAFLVDSIKEKRFVFCSSDMLSEQVIVKTVYDELANALKHAPTVDAEPVRHGRWERGKWATYPDGYVCDQCNTGYALPYSHCPNCGAKMDEEV